MTSNIERAAQIRLQIASLQHELNSLQLAPTPGPSTLPTTTQPQKKKKKDRSAIGPMPASLLASKKRHIALLFSYEGWSYSGLAYQPSHHPTPLPTVEGALLDALSGARLIEGGIENDGFGCGFERCGRTDAGVSSSAQVVNLWVRSDLEDPMGAINVPEEEREPYMGPKSTLASRERERSRSPSPVPDATDAPSPLPPAKKRSYATVELPYIQLLNRFLPPSIRVLAWSPVSPTFSSRYSCIWRHYKYFFSVTPSNIPQYDFGTIYDTLGRSKEKAEKERKLKEIWLGGMELDVVLMKEALGGIVGEHDFRNLCKVDPCKQLTSHVRTVISASIDSVEGEGEDMFVLNLRGGAFLYNQVRNIVAVLFLIGAKFEPPSILSDLLWTEHRTPTTLSLHSATSKQVEINAKPGFEMADDLPLVLWSCGYNNKELDWRLGNETLPGDVAGLSSMAQSILNGTGEEDSETELETRGNGKLKIPLDPSDTFRRQFLHMNELYTSHRLKSIILKHHLSAFSSLVPSSATSSKPRNFEIIPHGAGRSSVTRTYIDLLKRPRTETPEVANRKWAEGKGKGKMKVREEGKEKADEERRVNLAKKAAAKEEAEREERRRKVEEEGGAR